MNTKHTPGPWRFSFKTTKTNNIGIYDQHGSLLATVDVHQIANKQTMQRRSSDARLIAAAPELLEALQAIEPFLDSIICYASTMNEHEPNRIAHNARAAIAKATGEQP